MIRLAKALGDVMKLGAHRHVFCSSICPLKRCYCYETERIARQYQEDSGVGGSDCKKSESVELQPTFEIGNSAAQNSFAARNYQQTMATKHVAYTSVVEMDTHFSVLSVWGAVAHSCKVQRPREHWYNSLAVNIRSKTYIACTFRGTTLYWFDWPFGTENAAESGAEIGRMDDGPSSSFARQELWCWIPVLILLRLQKYICNCVSTAGLLHVKMT